MPFAWPSSARPSLRRCSTPWSSSARNAWCAVCAMLSPNSEPAHRRLSCMECGSLAAAFAVGRYFHSQSGSPAPALHSRLIWLLRDTSRAEARLTSSRRKFLEKLLSTPIAAAATPHFLRNLNFYAADDLARKLAADPLRPQFHLLPEKNWMNDPNGPIFWNGMYHMFFQYNPGAAVWGDMHWAHAVSPDMIHWKHLPIALAPTPGSDDAHGCFTGSALDDRGTASIVYTGVKSSTLETATLRDGTHTFREVQCLATSADAQLRTWTKWKNPIIEP